MAEMIAHGDARKEPERERNWMRFCWMDGNKKETVSATPPNRRASSNAHGISTGPGGRCSIPARTRIISRLMTSDSLTLPIDDSSRSRPSVPILVGVRNTDGADAGIAVIQYRRIDRIHAKTRLHESLGRSRIALY